MRAGCIKNAEALLGDKTTWYEVLTDTLRHYVMVYMDSCIHTKVVPFLDSRVYTYSDSYLIASGQILHSTPWYTDHMSYAYLGANVLSLVLWSVLFLARKDLRKMMFVMSVCAMPLAFLDLLFVPAYWKPLTLLHAPVGIEGFLFSFSAGGIASVLYAEIARRTPRRAYDSTERMWWVPVFAFGVFVLLCAVRIPNPELAAYAALSLGAGIMLYLRPDLWASIIYGATTFGAAYFLCLKLWTLLFPSVQSWFVLHGMPRVFIWGVPGSEIVFGFFFGAFWGSLYELLFGYRFVALKRPRGDRSLTL